VARAAPAKPSRLRAVHKGVACTGGRLSVASGWRALGRGNRLLVSLTAETRGDAGEQGHRTSRDSRLKVASQGGDGRGKHSIFKASHTP
jgi:hypothetical protein